MGHRVKWDEDTIAEHDKDRGTRMVIDEPDTPFVRSPPCEGDSASSSTSLQNIALKGAPILEEGIINGEAAPGILPIIGPGSSIEAKLKIVPHVSASSCTAPGPAPDEVPILQKKPNPSGSKPLFEEDVETRLEKWLQNPEIDAEEKKAAEFAKKRQQHYNEFELVKKMREQALLEDDEDEDSDEESEGKG